MNENNMRKMILVEDRPWNVIESLKELEQQGVEIEEICWFVEQSMDSTFIEQKIAELSDKLKKVKIGTIDYTNFDSTMDGYMAREDIFVLMDTFLEAAPMRISNRINIRYAVKRKEEIQGKLWFYTTAGSDILSYLRENFGRKQVITVCGVEFVSNQVRLETQQIVKAGLRKREL